VQVEPAWYPARHLRAGWTCLV